MKASVLIVTYNHEKYVAQAIDSALKQQTNFPYEIVIGDDLSTDSTPTILHDYASRYPGKIRVLPRTEKLGARRNFTNTFKNCAGEYIAWLDGDDYWTSSEKLQLQISYLDAHPDCVGCFHPVQLVFEDERPPLVFPTAAKSFYETEDMLKNNIGSFGASCSMVIRHVIQEFPDWFYEVKVGDWPLHIINSFYGKYAYIDQVMAVYRKHAGGVWSKLNSFERIASKISILKILKIQLPRNFRKTITDEISKTYTLLATAYEQDGNDRSAETAYLKSLLEKPTQGFTNYRSLLRVSTRSRMPAVYRAIRAAKGSK